MAGLLKSICIVTFLVMAGFECVKSAGVCGTLSPDKVALQLAPCSVAASNGKAPVSKNCCVQVKRIGRNPKCLCAVLLSNTAKSAGVKPQLLFLSPNAATSLIVQSATNVDLTPCLDEETTNCE